jgi:hypothetical protein
LKKLLRDLFNKQGYEWDCMYDWTLKKAGKKLPEENFAAKKEIVEQA